MKLNLLLTSWMLVALVLPSSAAVVQVLTPAGLGAGPFTTHTFENGAGGNGALYWALSGVELGHASSFANNITPSGEWGLTTSGFPDILTITFDAPASAAGLWFGNDDLCCTSEFTAYLDVFDGANLLGTVSLLANMNDAADQFLGFTSSDPVTSMQFRMGSGSDVQLYTYIDDVQFNSVAASVPEPGSAFLLAPALAGPGMASPPPLDLFEIEPPHPRAPAPTPRYGVGSASIYNWCSPDVGPAKHYNSTNTP